MSYDPKGALLAGIFAKWAGSTLASEIGSLRRISIPANVSSHPYALLRDSDLLDLGMTCGRQRFECEVELLVYDKTPELVATHKGKIDQVFSSDSLSLSLSGVTLESCRMVASSDAEQDDNVWRAGLSYRFRIHRGRIA
jgi:hypothetical protein